MHTVKCVIGAVNHITLLPVQSVWLPNKGLTSDDQSSAPFPSAPKSPAQRNTHRLSETIQKRERQREKKKEKKKSRRE